MFHSEAVLTYYAYIQYSSKNKEGAEITLPREQGQSQWEGSHQETKDTDASEPKLPAISDC